MKKSKWLDEGKGVQKEGFKLCLEQGNDQGGQCSSKAATRVTECAEGSLDRARSGPQKQKLSILLTAFSGLLGFCLKASTYVVGL